MGAKCGAATSLRSCCVVLGDQDGWGTNRLSKAESILGTGMSQNLSRGRRHACETRPWLQGSRLTAWELVRDGIPVSLLADGAAAARLAAGGVDWVIVGSAALPPMATWPTRSGLRASEKIDHPNFVIGLIVTNPDSRSGFLSNRFSNSRMACLLRDTPAL